MHCALKRGEEGGGGEREERGEGGEEGGGEGGDEGEGGEGRGMKKGRGRRGGGEGRGEGGEREGGRRVQCMHHYACLILGKSLKSPHVCTVMSQQACGPHLP